MRHRKRVRLGGALVLLVLLGCGSEETRAAPSPAASAEWLKGQLHAHTARSGDSETPPADVVRWYREHGYDFVVLTDHDHVTLEPRAGRMLVIPGVELTQNARACDPPAEPGLACLLHVNALFVEPRHAGPLHVAGVGLSRESRFVAAIDLARARGGIAQINHPNFHYAADGALLAQLGRRGALLLEVANEAVDSNNDGDPTHPPVEALWDAALSQGARLFGTATDDAHHYEDAPAVRARGEIAYVGDRGWVMVRAARDAGAIRRALERGDFYFTNGPALRDVEREGGTLRVAIDPGLPPHEVRFVGPGGAILQTVRGHMAERAAGRGYVRAVVVAPDGRRAWTQPVFAD